MPRIFASHDEHNFNQGAVNFENGVGVLPYGDESIPWFQVTGKNYTIDNSKHALTAFDRLPRATLDSIAVYMGITLDPTDGKYEVIRDIEGFISTANLGSITVSSAAGTETGDTKITITGTAGTGNKYYYKCAAGALSPLYGDQIDGGWKEIATGDEITPGATDTHITVVKAVEASGFILAKGSATITKKTT